MLTYCILISIIFDLLVPAIGKEESSLQSCSERGCIDTQSQTTECKGGYSNF